jgi:hypothetical protein
MAKNDNFEWGKDGMEPYYNYGKMAGMQCNSYTIQTIEMNVECVQCNGMGPWAMQPRPPPW